MGAYDEALAKSFETGDAIDLGRIAIFGAEDLFKAHVKAHFRLNPKTGRREFIKDYDDARHKDQIHISFHKGDKVKVNNPRSKHHGKTMKVTGYSDKYDVVRGKVEGNKNSVDFHADHLEHPADKKAASKTGMNMAEIKTKLGLGDFEPDAKAYESVRKMIGADYGPMAMSRAIEAGMSNKDLVILYEALRSHDSPNASKVVYQELHKRAEKADAKLGNLDKVPTPELKKMATTFTDMLKKKPKDPSLQNYVLQVMKEIGNRKGAKKNPNPRLPAAGDSFVKQSGGMSKEAEKLKEAIGRVGRMPVWNQPKDAAGRLVLALKKANMVGVSKAKIKELLTEMDTGAHDPAAINTMVEDAYKKLAYGNTAPVEKLKFDKFGAHDIRVGSSVASAQRKLKEYGITWDKSDKSGSQGGVLYEKGGETVAYFDAAGRTLTIYKPKEKKTA